uniref:C2H2-type domain-containing protein n=1 Tax=Panagrolaimus sp. JU765 TaxID=591449 RepID=A0AC34Q8S3_9BILA
KCQKEFHARRNLYFHERQVHDVKKTCCPDCGKPLRNHATLIRHRRTHYGVHEMVHICPECGKRCKERRHLVIHCSNVGHPVPPESIMNSNPFGLNFREILRDDGSMKFLP